MRQRQALIERITRMRRDGAAGDPPSDADPRNAPPEALAALERRIAHLEKLVEGLQDSVHRESTRQRKQIADLEAQVEPAALAVALDKNARLRGL